MGTSRSISTRKEKKLSSAIWMASPARYILPGVWHGGSLAGNTHRASETNSRPRLPEEAAFASALAGGPSCGEQAARALLVFAHRQTSCNLHSRASLV